MQTLLFDTENNTIRTINYAEQQQVRLMTELIHRNAHRSLLKALEARTKEELIKGFANEMWAKNKAYSFILESGLIHQFHEFCTNQQISK